MMVLNDAINLQKRQAYRILELRNAILSKLSEKINNLSRNGQIKFIYSVPQYLFGFHSFDVDEMTTFLTKKLKHEGYCAIKLNSCNIYISWDIKEINMLNDKKKKDIKNLKSMLHIINIK